MQCVATAMGWGSFFLGAVVFVWGNIWWAGWFGEGAGGTASGLAGLPGLAGLLACWRAYWWQGVTAYQRAWQRGALFPWGVRAGFHRFRLVCIFLFVKSLRGVS